MKISSRSTGGTMQMPDSHFVNETAFAKVSLALSTFLSTLNQVGTAIALGEAGDLEGAKALREKHAGKKS